MVEKSKGKSTFMWIGIFVIMIVVILAALFMGIGGLDARGQFTKDEFSQNVGAPLEVTRTIGTCDGTNDICTAALSPGQEVQVSLNIQLGAADGYQVAEVIPAQFQLISKGNFGGTPKTLPDGRINLTHAVLGGLTANEVLTYTIKLPSSLDASYNLFGTYTFQSSEHLINGEPAVVGTDPGEEVMIGGVKILNFQDGTIIVNLNEPASVSINGVQAGIGTLTVQKPYGQYTLSFSSVTGKLQIAPVVVDINPGQTKTVSCTFIDPDPADTSDSSGNPQADGFVDGSEINYVIQQYLQANFPQATLSKSIQNFYKGNYYPPSAQCSIV